MSLERDSAFQIVDSTPLDAENLKPKPTGLATAGPQLTAPLTWGRVLVWMGSHQIINVSLGKSLSLIHI